MARSQSDKQKTHDRIVSIAARRLREEGLDGIGVADLMKEAGLTVGGFYKHFASRDDLVAEAMQSAFGDWARRLAERGGSADDLTLSEFADEYLGKHHRDTPGEGCPFPALTADFARSDAKIRAVATAQLKRNFDLFEERQAEGGAQSRRNAIVAFCALSGAVGLARVCDDDALSVEILDAVKSFLAAMDAPSN